MVTKSSDFRCKPAVRHDNGKPNEGVSHWRFGPSADNIGLCHVNIKLLSFLLITPVIVASLAQTIELGYPSDGTVLQMGTNFSVQVILPVSIQQEHISTLTERIPWLPVSMLELH